MEKVKIEGLEYYKISNPEIKTVLPKILPNDINVEWVTSHWTAGAYNHAYRHYQINVGDNYILVSTNLNSWLTHQHTWQRNFHNIGLAYMAMAKNYPITKGMIEIGALTQAVIKDKYNLDWDKFLDHAYWANLDGYSHLRWDIRLKLNNGKTLYEEVLEKTKWYYEKYFRQK